MNVPSRTAALTCWGITLIGCAATWILGYNVLFAWALSGLISLFESPAAGPSQLDNTDLLWPLLPSAVAAGVNLWVLWGRKTHAPGVSPWWIVPALALALLTFAFGAWVCVDVWHTDPMPSGTK